MSYFPDGFGTAGAGSLWFLLFRAKGRKGLDAVADTMVMLLPCSFFSNLIIIIVVMIRQKETNQKKNTKLHPMVAQPLHFFWLISSYGKHQVAFLTLTSQGGEFVAFHAAPIAHPSHLPDPFSYTAGFRNTLFILPGFAEIYFNQALSRPSDLFSLEDWG